MSWEGDAGRKSIEALVGKRERKPARAGVIHLEKTEEIKRQRTL